MSSAEEKRIGLEAAGWVVKFDGVDFDAGDVRAFRRWMAKSDAHRAAFESASRTWNQLDILSKLQTFEATEAQRMRTPTRRQAMAGASAIGVGAIALSVIALSNTTAEAFETGIGEQREVALSDGSRVVLNADSRLEANISQDRREARLVSGEALFAVAPGAAIFRIETPRGDIEIAEGDVLVKVLTDGARITLLSNGARASRRTWLRDPAPVLASASSEILIDAQNLSVNVASDATRARRLLWREGKLAFDDTPIREALDDVSRQTGARFVLKGAAIETLRVAGLIDARDLDAFTDLLRQNLGLLVVGRSDGVFEISQAPAQVDG
ncbi:MAG: FecR domain-containing protein [Phycisphaerales bacterium]|nr:FecR domain-containing protein [Hyphomonadaceae bacterium]